MKRLYSALVLGLLLFSSRAVSQANIVPVWSKSIGGSGDDRANAIIRTSDGGFLVVGYSKSNNGDVSGHHGALTTKDAWVVKLDAAGTIEWQRSLGGSADDEFVSVLVTPDNNYLCAGTTNSVDGDVTDVSTPQKAWVVKLSRQGNIIWQKSYTGNLGASIASIRRITNGYAFAGSLNSLAWVVKLDTSGTITFQKTIGAANINAAFDVAETEDNGLLVLVFCNSIPPNVPGWTATNTRQGLIKINASGTIIWSLNTPYTDSNVRSLLRGANNRYFVGQYFGMNCFNPPGLNYVAGGVLANYINYNPLATTAPASTVVGTMAPPCPPVNTTGYNYSYDQPQGIHLLDDSALVMTTGTNQPLPGAHGSTDGIVMGMKLGSGVTWTKVLGGTGSDNLVSVTAIDEFQIVAAGYSNTNNNGDVPVNHGSNDAWIVKIGKANTVKGTVYMDYNSNGVKDANEPFANNVLVETKKTGFNTSRLTVNGGFTNYVDTGNYITKVTGNVTYYTALPVQLNSNFTTYYNTDSLSFRLQPIPGQRDYAVSIHSNSNVRSGGSMTYSIECRNLGTDTLVNKQVKLIKDSRIHFSSASPAPVSVVADTITWNIASLNPRGTMMIQAQFSISTPPTVVIGDSIISVVSIDSTGDLLTSNNRAQSLRRVTGSYDPNDKLESGGGTLRITDLPGKELTYTIRFQNTGNDTAFNITVRDTLDAKLDWSSIEMVEASHPYTFEAKNGNALSWTFTNILLPDSNRNEPASHGYITYRIKPKSNLVVGDVINNSASIYFDFNLPVKTNTQVTTVKAVSVAQPSVSGVASNYCSTQGVQKGKINNLPANGSGVTATAKLDGNAIAIAADSTFSFDVSALAAGQHSIVVSYSNGSETKSSTNNFTVTAAVTPDVNVSANATTLANLNDPLTVTASNAAGGGSTPLYAFAKDRNFTTLWQAESANNAFNTTGNSLNTGDNWIYVRMKTSSTCFTTLYNIDSIKITLSLPAPNIPAVTGIKASYCNNEGVQKAKITNYPAAGTGTTVTAKLNGTVIPIVMTDTSFTFDVTNLGGNNVIDVSYANPTATRTTTINFAVTVAVAPQVDLTASSTTVKDGQVSLTATQLAGGGTPSYTFATDRNFTNIIRPESPNGILTLNVSSLKLGNTQFFVLMKTTATCSTKPTATDSITITKISATGLVDPDYPNQTISANPNPFRNQLVLYGLNASKTYTITVYSQQGKVISKTRVSGQSSRTFYIPGQPAGAYTLGIYDETKKRLIGNLQVVKQ